MDTNEGHNNENVENPDYTGEAANRESMVEAVRQGVKSGNVTLPEKFGGDPEKFVDSYLELERKLSTARQGGDAGVPSGDAGTEQPAHPPTTESKEAEAGAEGQVNPDQWADLTSAPTESTAPNMEAVWKEVNDELTAKGSISEETAKKHSLPNEFVQRLTTMHKTTTQADRAKAIEQMGNEEHFNNVMNWAKTKLPAEEKKHIEAQLKSQHWSLALDALAARYARENGQPTHINVSAPTGSGVKPFSSTQEQQAYFADPRYQTNPEFRDHVMKRMMETMKRK